MHNGGGWLEYHRFIDRLQKGCTFPYPYKLKYYWEPLIIMTETNCNQTPFTYTKKEEFHDWGSGWAIPAELFWIWTNCAVSAPSRHWALNLQLGSNCCLTVTYVVVLVTSFEVIFIKLACRRGEGSFPESCWCALSQAPTPKLLRVQRPYVSDCMCLFVHLDVE